MQLPFPPGSLQETQKKQEHFSSVRLTTFLFLSRGSQLGKEMIWNSKIKIEIKKKEKKRKIKHPGCGWWTNVSSCPSPGGIWGAEERGEVLSESTCFLRGMWETGTMVASVMSLGPACYKHRTRTQFRNAGANKHTFTHEEILVPLGNPAFKVLSNDAAPNLHTLCLEFMWKGDICIKCSSTEKLQVAWLFCPTDSLSHTHTHSTPRTPICSSVSWRDVASNPARVRPWSKDQYSHIILLHARTWQRRWGDWHTYIDFQKSQEKNQV